MNRISINMVVLTLFVVLVSALLVTGGEEPDRGMIFELGLREVAVTLQLAEEMTEAGIAPEPGPAIAAIADDAPSTDETFIAAAATMLAFGADEAAAEWLGRVRAPAPMSLLLDAIRTGSIDPWSEAEVTALRELEKVPDVARDRLIARYHAASGREDLAAALRARIEDERQGLVTRLGAVVSVLGIAALAGLVLLLFMRRVRAFLARTVGGIQGSSPFFISFRGIYTLMVGWFAFHLALSVLLPMLLAPTGLVRSQPGVVIALTSGLSGVFGILLVHRLAFPRDGLLRALGLHRGGVKKGPVLAAAWGLVFYSASVPLWLSATMVNQALSSQDTVVTNPVIPLLAQADSTLSLALLALSVSVLAPIFEEALFRGFLFRAVRDRLGVLPGVLISAAAFALVHLSFMTVLPLFVLGCVLALSYEWTGSLLPAIVLHAVNNTISMALILATLS